MSESKNSGSSDSDEEKYSDDSFDHEDSPHKNISPTTTRITSPRNSSNKDTITQTPSPKQPPPKPDFEESAWQSIEFDQIELNEQIGGGGVGLVYKGYFEDSPVALKTLFDPKVNEDLKQEFMDELLIMSQVNHPNIVAFYGACLTAPNLCFVMELCKCSLFDLLHKNSNDSFSKYQRVDWCCQIAAGMKYLHAQIPPIVHRDIKSQNILISEADEQIKLCDFGLVRTKTSSAGTPNYMPPELFLGLPFSKAVDVYAFALVMHEIFTQELPFQSYDVDDIRRNVIGGTRPEIPTLDVPFDCQEIIRLGWDGDPKRRPNFDEIYERLLAVLEETPKRSALEELEICGGGSELDSLSDFM